MQIKKIDNNKLKVILSINDLNKKNIDIDSFLSNSIESQDLFFEILDLAEEEFDFNIENGKAVVEAISLDNNIFILTITKLKYELSNTYTAFPKIYCFDSIDDILKLYSYLSFVNINFKNFQIYLLGNKYYLVLNQNCSILQDILYEYSYLIDTSDSFEDILIEHGKKISIGV